MKQWTATVRMGPDEQRYDVTARDSDSALVAILEEVARPGVIVTNLCRVLGIYQDGEVA